MRRTAFWVMLGCGVLLAACGKDSKPQPTKVQHGNSTGITIAAEYNANNVRPLAESHCQKYGKRAVIQDANPIGDSVDSGWACGVKPYIFKYACF